MDRTNANDEHLGRNNIGPCALMVGLIDCAHYFSHKTLLQLENDHGEFLVFASIIVSSESNCSTMAAAPTAIRVRIRSQLNPV